MLGTNGGPLSHSDVLSLGFPGSQFSISTQIKRHEINLYESRFLSNLLDRKLLTSARVPQLLLQFRLSLFPNNSLGAVRSTPTPAEQLAIRRTAALSILSLIPRPVARRIFNTKFDRRLNGRMTLLNSMPLVAAEEAAVKPRLVSLSSSEASRSPSPTAGGTIAAASKSSLAATMAASEANDSGDAASRSDGNQRRDHDANARTNPNDEEEEAMLHDIEDTLDVFGDAYLNKHLVFGIVELLFVRLMPELSDKGVRELLEERDVAV